MTDPAEKARTLYNAATVVNEYRDDPEVCWKVRDLVAAAIGREPGETWQELLRATRRLDVVDLEVPYQYRAAEQDIRERELAHALYAVLNGTDMRPCTTCLESRPGQPWDVAARTEPGYPMWGGLCGHHRKDQP